MIISRTRSWHTGKIDTLYIYTIMTNCKYYVKNTRSVKTGEILRILDIPVHSNTNPELCLKSSSLLVEKEKISISAFVHRHF